MQFDWTYFTVVLAGMFAIMNPIGNAPIFLGLVDGLDNETRKKVALKSVLVAFIIIVVFVLFGFAIFQSFGITVQAFRITGGILVVKVGFDMLTHSQSKVHSAKDTEAQAEDDSVAISPLGIPILAGPGTISTAINFVGVHNKWEDIIVVVICSFVILLATYIAFMSSGKIVKFIGHEFLSAISKIMGLLIASIGVQMVISGIINVLQQNHVIG